MSMFYSFLSVFDRFRLCECMSKHAFAGRNTQQYSKNIFSKFIPTVLVKYKASTPLETFLPASMDKTISEVKLFFVVKNAPTFCR